MFVTLFRLLILRCKVFIGMLDDISLQKHAQILCVYSVLKYFKQQNPRQTNSQTGNRNFQAFLILTKVITAAPKTFDFLTFYRFSVFSSL